MAARSASKNGSSNRWIVIFAAATLALGLGSNVISYLLSGNTLQGDVKQNGLRLTEIERHAGRVDSQIETLRDRVTVVEKDASQNTTRINELDRRMGKTEADLLALNNRVTAIEKDLEKIETQFCNQSNIVNMMHSKDIAVLAPLFYKAFSVTYPTDSLVYPTIGSCK